MIEKAEIDRMAQELDVHTSNVQRDYVFGWLLSGIYQPDNPIGRQLVLKGGNGFRKAYFPNGRFSNDLDFSTTSALDTDLFLASINRALRHAGRRSGVEFLPDESRINFRRGLDGETQLWEARIYFRSFYGEEEATLRVKLDIGEYDRIYLPVQTRRLIHAYTDAAECQAEVICVKLEELLASKLNALLHRRHSADLYDFIHAVFFQKQLDVRRLEIVTTFLKKTIYEGDPSVAKSLLLGYPFQAIREFWTKYLVCPKVSLFAFDDAVTWFQRVIEEVFALLEPRFAAVGYSGRYFASGQRDLIMEAGRMRRMLKLLYDDHLREVEPYALAYKRRKDGTAREYFYAWDRSGGHSGQIGIKSFTASNVQQLEMTDTSFEPRFPIEFEKDGGYFSQTSFSSHHPTRARASRSAAEYTIQCPYCGKKFRRAKYNLRLNEHKDGYGNRCYGRLGYLV